MSDDLNECEKLSQAFSIFANYDDAAHEVATEHDVIYAGPLPDNTMKVHKERLVELGWRECDEFDCWSYRT